jgi:hypothetical protein
MGDSPVLVGEEEEEEEEEVVWSVECQRVTPAAVCMGTLEMRATGGKVQLTMNE